MPNSLLTAHGIAGHSTTRRSLVRSLFAALSAVALIFGLTVVVAPAAVATTPCSNEIACENLLPGTPQSVWDVSGAGDPSIQGFATQMSVNRGTAISFKIKTDAAAYTIQIFRLGFYQGNGARKIADVTPSAHLPQTQPACATSTATEIYDCGTWGVSASWSVPSTAVSGVYIARLYRADKDDASQIPFIVRNDASTSQVVFQTSDATWQAYNTYGGSDFYTGLANGRAYKLSYNRPFATRNGVEARDYLFSNEYPMIRFLESNGYDMSYISSLDTDQSGLNLNGNGTNIQNHKVFLSVGHDEYWSDKQRANVANARNAGVNLAFFSGNEVYWKTRWEPSQDGTNTLNRTLVCYKDTWANAVIDPAPAPTGPTATWRDPRFGDNGKGPENALTGTAYMANNSDLAITVNAEEGKLRLWRGTSLATQAAGTSTALAPHTVGYESDEDLDNGYRPAGLIRMSTTTGAVTQYLQDFGNTTAPGTTTHHLTMYKAPSGALVFGAGTVQWAWALDVNHDGVVAPVDTRMQQATVNILADMSANATTLSTLGVVAATKSLDTVAPTAVITAPASGGTIGQGSTVTVTGTATDAGGGVVAGVEVSLDGGTTWHPATGRASFSYTGVVAATGSSAIKARAIDDSGNIQSPATTLPLTVNCPCSIFGSAVPATPAANDSSAVTLGVKFTTSASGFITGLRFYKGAGNSGTHTGTLYKADGTALSSVTFTNETATGWQTATFPSAVPISTGTTYIASYVAPSGHYSADSQYFASMGKTSGVLTALGSSTNTNGVYSTGTGVPSSSYNQTNYYVDVVYSQTDTTPLTVPSTTPVAGSTSVPSTTPITGTFSRDPDAGSVTMSVKDSAGNAVPGTTSAVSAQRVVTFTPTGTLTAGGTYTATLNGKAGGVAMTPAATWTFTIVKPDAVSGVCPCSLFNDSDAPAVAAENDPNSVELGVAFTADTAGVVTGVKFYKGPGNTGTHTISLWSSTGTQLATTTVSAESTTGWQTATFATPVNVAANTSYIASYRAPVGRYSDTANGLGAARDRAPLHTTINAGRYTYGAGAPLTSAGTNYFVDPIFTVAASAAPTVTAVAPANQATSVPVTTKVTVTFSTQVQPGSATVTLKDANGVNVPGAAGNEPLGSTASFTPTAALAAAQSYTVTVSGAKNLGGTPMAAPFTSTFKTAGASVCPCSLLASTATPPVSDSGDASPISVGLNFTTSVDGFITGLRYYRDAANTGTHTGALYSATGTKIASLTFPTTAAGWQTATFASPVAVTAGTTYVASTFMPVGHYSVATNFFATPVVNTPLTGTLGTYTYGSDTFPASSWNNSYYFVDVTFNAQDTAPPTVTSTSPDGSVPVQPDASVSATFARSITNDASLVMTLKDAGGTAVAGTVSYATATSTATFQPAIALTQGVTYTASIQAKSASGVSMPAATVWTFSTVAASPAGIKSSLYADTDTPVNAAWNDNGPITVGIKFSPAQSGSVTAVKFYAGAGNNGPYTVDLWASDGTKLGTGVATGNATVNKWKTVILNSPVAVTGGANYVASYRGSSGHYAVTSGGLAGGKTTGPLQIPANGAVYSYPVGFPSSATGSDFAVDVVAVLNAAAPPTPVAPTVTATSPGAALAQPDAPATATFDQDIQVNTLVMSLKNGSTSIPGIATYDSSSKTATFTPSAVLPFGASLTASAKATSAAGAAMATAATWTFATVATPQQGTASSVFAPTAVPTTAAYADNGPVSVGLKFSSDQAGFVTAIKFYVGAGNTGPWAVDLWNSAGVRIGGGQATGAASGWKTVVLDASVAVQAGATYTASYRGATGHYALNSGGLSAAMDLPPLHTPANAGVYSYPAAFPASATGTDFAVDVVLVVPVAPVAPAAAALQQTDGTEPPSTPTVTSQATVATSPTDPPTTSASSSAASSTTTPTP